jgi:hypothetical protein
MKTGINHNRVYCTILAFFVVLTECNACLLFYWDQTVGEPVGHLSAGAVCWVAALNVGYSVAMLVTLWSRLFRRKFGRRLTRFLNWALLPAFLCGTALGIYGLLKVDRNEGHAL